MSTTNSQKVTLVGLLVTLGIVYGDIGTSPLYVMKPIIAGKPISELLVLGALSCIFWTLTLQTTIKYILLTLQADNKGEGGIFALYTLIRKRESLWLVLPAIIGGSMLLADGVITPPISVASAIEGLQIINPSLNTVPLIIIILLALFCIQPFGTNKIGKLFGPVMLLWFSMIGILGFCSLIGNVQVLKAINPLYAFKLLSQYPGGFWLLGAVFLCSTGAEALYSDLGHCGRQNIRVSWGFVKTALILNYFGQGAWLLSHSGQVFDERFNPFYAIMPNWFLITGITIATAATIIASQALISGSFTLVNEAIRLNLWPKLEITYPSEQKGQLYVSFMNWFLCICCIGVTLYFKESANMEAAFGLAVTLTMLMTSLLFAAYLHSRGVSKAWITLYLFVYLSIESLFLVANLAKFFHGGWVTLLIGGCLFYVMAIYFQIRFIYRKYTQFENIDSALPLLCELSNDTSVPKLSTNLVFMTASNNTHQVENKILYSIFERQPKRADIYWFVHLETVDEPYVAKYKVNILAKEDAIRIDFQLGFRVEPKLNLFFQKVVEDLVKSGEINIFSRYESLKKKKVIGDFTFVILKRFLSKHNELPLMQDFIMRSFFFFDSISLPVEKAFGLDSNIVIIEKVPLVIKEAEGLKLERVLEPITE